MTSKTPRDEETAMDSRLIELMRADAAAAIDDDLDDEASFPKARRNAGISTRSPSQVYSIRVPVERLEQMRSLASARGLAPTAMMRQWVLARLDEEIGEESPVTPMHRALTSDATQEPPRRQERDAIPDRLEAAASALAEATLQMMKSFTALAELFTAQRSASAPSQVASPMLPPLPIMQLSAAPAIPALQWATHSPARAFACGPVALPVPFAATSGYVYRGVAALQSTVRESSTWPGLNEYNLDSLYAAADEVLSGP